MFVLYKLLKFLVRRVVIRFGRAPFFRYFMRTTGTQETIEEIVVATTLLSDGHRGAIMAVERDVGLRGYIESGIRLDAALTYDLLVTIFQVRFSAARRRGDYTRGPPGCSRLFSTSNG